MVLPDETCRDASGKPVTRALIATGKSRMRRHRGDWHRFGCPGPILRCGT
jgi:hypothetical protein